MHRKNRLVTTKRHQDIYTLEAEEFPRHPNLENTDYKCIVTWCPKNIYHQEFQLCEKHFNSWQSWIRLPLIDFIKMKSKYDCDVCGRIIKHKVIDHWHQCGRHPELQGCMLCIRGIVCYGCNSTYIAQADELGYFGNDHARVYEFAKELRLKRHGDQVSEWDDETQALYDYKTGDVCFFKHDEWESPVLIDTPNWEDFEPDNDEEEAVQNRRHGATPVKDKPYEGSPDDNWEFLDRFKSRYDFLNK